MTFGIASFFDGSLADGTVTITAPSNVIHTPTNRPIFSSQISKRFVDGVASFNLCPTDADGLNNKSWTYKANIVVSGALVQPDPIYFVLTQAGPDEVDLDGLVTVPSSAGVPISATVVTSVNGQTGDVTVEGGTGSGTASGSVRRGVYIPEGSLDVWRAARANAANELVEVTVFGDSTSSGSVFDPPANSNNTYSWIQRLRARITQAGLPYGGMGVIGAGETAPGTNPDGFAAVVSNTGFTQGTSFSWGTLREETFVSASGGDTLTVQGKGTAIRIHYTSLGETGGFSYSIDGGAPVNVDTPAPTADVAHETILAASGLTDGTHTVTITNLGGRLNGGTRNTAAQRVVVTPAFIRATGVVVNKAAISGIASGSFFHPQNTQLGNWRAQALLGLAPGVPSDGSRFGWAQSEAAHPRYTRCRLAICALGINDMQGSASQADPDTAVRKAVSDYRNSLAIFVRMARSAGADPLIVIPHFNLALGADAYAGDFISAAASVAVAMSVPFCDFNEALGPAGRWAANGVVPAVHANVHAYDLEADFLWDNLLSSGTASTPPSGGGGGSTPTVPAQVTGLTNGTPGATVLPLSWTAVSGATSYKVEHKATSSSTWTTDSSSVVGASYTVTGLTAGVSYDFRVSAVNTAGTGPTSTVLTVSTAASQPTTTAPAQVTGLAVGTPTQTAVPLSWTAPADGGAAITDYLVQYRTTGSSTWNLFPDGTGTATSTNVTSLTAATGYDFRVAAVNSVGTGTYSATATATTAAPTPVAPTFTDDFNRADGQIGNGWTLSFGGSDFFRIASGVVTETSNWGAQATRDLGSADGTIEFDRTGGAPVVLRYVDSLNYIKFTGSNFLKTTDGTETFAAGTGSSVNAANGRVRVVMSGSKLTAYLDAVEVAHADDTFNQGVTVHGFRLEQTTNTVDNFSFTPPA